MNSFIIYRNTITSSFQRMWEGNSAIDTMTTQSMSIGDFICYVECTRFFKKTTGRKIISTIKSCVEIFDPINHNTFWIFEINPIQ